METMLLPGKQMRAFREYGSEIGLAPTLPPAKPHEPYDNEVGKRSTAEIAKAIDNFKGLRNANFADRRA
jgi:hypothetical protein